jgi:hypothetical protein
MTIAQYVPQCLRNRLQKPAPQKFYKPNRVIRIRPAQKVALVVRPERAGPQNQTYEYATD